MLYNNNIDMMKYEQFFFFIQKLEMRLTSISYHDFKNQEGLFGAPVPVCKSEHCILYLCVKLLSVFRGVLSVHDVLRTASNA